MLEYLTQCTMTINHNNAGLGGLVAAHSGSSHWPGAQPGSRNTVGSHQSATVQYGGANSLAGSECADWPSVLSAREQPATSLPLNWASPDLAGGGPTLVTHW